jgi:hypothetical protein
MSKKLMARVCVLADRDHEAVASALQSAGYKVLVDKSYVEQTDAVYLEASRGVADDFNTALAADEMLDDVARIVEQIVPSNDGSTVSDCGPVGPEHTPFNYTVPPWIAA